MYVTFFGSEVSVEKDHTDKILRVWKESDGTVMAIFYTARVYVTRG